MVAGSFRPPDVAIKGCTMAVTRPFLDLWDWPPRGSRVSHDLWVALLAGAFGQRVNLSDPWVDHRLHESNTSGWVPDDSSRVFTSPGSRVDAVTLLVDLVLKPPNVGRRTRAFMDVLEARGDAVDHEAAQRLRQVLRRNRRRHRERRTPTA